MDCTAGSSDDIPRSLAFADTQVGPFLTTLPKPSTPGVGVVVDIFYSEWISVKSQGLFNCRMTA